MKKTPSHRSGLVLPLHRIWLLSLPFRWATRAPAPGFAPGLRNVLAYEKGRLWHLLHERERLVYRWLRLRAGWGARD